MTAVAITAICLLMLAPFATDTIAQDRLPASSAGDRSDAADPLATFISEASRRFGVPELWIRAVVRAESYGDDRALSRKGARGLMQIMPETWDELRAKHMLGSDPYDPRDNILAGAAYLREMHDRFGAPGFLAAYNAGPTRYADHLATGRPLPEETRLYLERLTPIIAGTQPDAPLVTAPDPLAWTKVPLFAVGASGTSVDDRSQVIGQPEGKSVAAPSLWAPRDDGLFVPPSRPRIPQ